jgi:GNAT superfamily N-acetyltransferase
VTVDLNPGLNPELTLRSITGTESDIDTVLDGVDTVLMAAYKTTSRRDRVQRFLQVEPGGWVVIEQRGQVVATGGCISYPDAGFGWVGLIGTDPQAERRGLGRIVTQWVVDYLASKGCASVLDGSASGAPLYARMGFVDCGASHLMQAPNRVYRIEDSRVSVARADDLAEIARYDRPRFGADRSRLVRAMFDLYPGRVLVARHLGGVIGFGVAQNDSIGPLVADTESAARDLLSALCNLPWASPAKMVLAPETAHTDVVVQLGFTEQRTLRRQQLGRTGSLPGQRATMLAQASFGEG